MVVKSNEETPLMPATNQPEEQSACESSISKSKQKIMLVSLLSLQFCVLATDTFIIPFFPAVAHEKGLTEIHIGVIYSAYEMTRFIMSPVYGTKVSSSRK